VRALIAADTLEDMQECWVEKYFGGFLVKPEGGFFRIEEVNGVASLVQNGLFKIVDNERFREDYINVKKLTNRLYLKLPIS
jgi:hypothetical protein